MSVDRNPQAQQMADESMVRCLCAQAEAVWPQESGLIDAYALPAEAVVLDVACGTGEIAWRMADRFPQARITGVDLVESHLTLARERCEVYGDRVRFQAGDAYALEFPDASFDLVLCRHLVQAVPDPDLIVGELVRVARPGARVHLVAEDYAMMHFHPSPLDTDQFWHQGPITFAASTGSDLRVGRKAYSMLRARGLTDIRVNYVIVDTLRVPRETFAAIWTAWRDGYSEAIAAHTEFSPEQVAAYWAEMLAAIRDPGGYGVWQLPVVSGVVPG